jgi:hypothetical protein
MMFIQINGRLINLSLLREVTFDGAATTLVFDPYRGDNPTFDGDFRTDIARKTGAKVVSAQVPAPVE